MQSLKLKKEKGRNNGMRNIIIDCDPGHDDAIALLMAIANKKELNILGITTVGGNQLLDKVTQNALKVLSLVNEDIPVASGEALPLIREVHTGGDAHGDSGMDGPVLPAPKYSAVSSNAVQFMYEKIKSSKEKVTLVPIGPLTNIALLLRVYPEIKNNIELICLMGGGIYSGNRTPAAEFNIYVDPEAAKIVFNSGVDIVMAGLDVTEKAMIMDDEREKLRNKGKVSNFVAELLDFYSIASKRFGFEGSALHDPCAIGYLLRPDLNDDITFEIAFLLTLSKYGKKIKSEQIADNWVSLIPFAWSAEDVALKNLLQGVMPPYSGRLNNPYKEWIGAQMRGAVCGMVAPGQPLKAARLAWIDGQISHYNNGIIGEVFNAVMTSLAFVEKNVRKIVEDTINILPAKSEYYNIVKFALDTCKKAKTAEKAFIICEEEYKKYNLVHAYPNAAIEVIALWFGEGDYNNTIYLTGMTGLDVDCNAAQVGNIIGIINAGKDIDEKWTQPIGTSFKTYVRNYETISIAELINLTVESKI